MLEMTLWEDDSSYLLANPSYKESDIKHFQRIVEISASKYPSHIWLATSGSLVQKWVGLSKEAFFVSARSVNAHIFATKSDIWVNALPTFHVGGLSIYARSLLSGSLVHDFRKTHHDKWDPKAFYRYLCEKKGTLTALVPAQLFDLCLLRYKAPIHLKAVIIGGGPLLPSLYQAARELQWPILPSFGMTECASQIATASMDTLKDRAKEIPPMEILPHIAARQEEETFSFSSRALLSTYATIEGEEMCFIDPKVEGWFRSSDRGVLEGNTIKVFGRMDCMIKVGGENVDVAKCEAKLQHLCHQFSPSIQATLCARKEERLGHSIQCIVEKNNEAHLEKLVKEYNSCVLPFERIRSTCVIEQIPRSPLGKIQRGELEKFLYHAQKINA